MTDFLRWRSYGMEIIFALLIYYSIYATSIYFEPVVAISPIDPNYLLLVVVALYTIWHVATRPIRRQTLVAIALFGVFATYYALTVLWSSSTAYADWKALRLVTVISLLFVGCALYFGGHRDRLPRFYFVALVFGGLVTVDTIYTLAILGYGNSPYLDVNYILSSRPIGVGIILATYFLVTIDRRALRAVLAGSVFVMVFAMFQTGARGPLVALVGALVVFAGWLYLQLDLSVSRSQLVAAAASSVVGFGVLVVTAGTTVERMLRLFRWDEEVSGAARVDLFTSAVQYWLEQPLIGHGIGSFPVLYSGEDERYYPHNIVLEVGVEAGLVGVVLFVAFSAWCLWVALKADTDPVLVGTTVSLYLYLLANAMITGDISTNRMLFASTALLLVVDSSTPVRVTETAGRLRTRLTQ